MCEVWDQDSAFKNEAAHARLWWWIKCKCTSTENDSDMLDFSGSSKVTTVVNDDSSDEDKDPGPIKTGT